MIESDLLLLATCATCEEKVAVEDRDDPCPKCYNSVSGYSTCHVCGERKMDPADFYDGLRCIMCCEADEEDDDAF